MNHDSYSDSYIHAILAAVKTVAVVGASTNPARASNIVIRYLVGKNTGHTPSTRFMPGRKSSARRPMPGWPTCLSPST